MRCGSRRSAPPGVGGIGVPDAHVDRDDIEWGIGVAWLAGLALAETAMQYMPANERQSYGDKILALIERRGVMKIRDVQMYIRGALRSSEIKDLLAQFVEAGLIEWTAEGYRRKR